VQSISKEEEDIGRKRLVGVFKRERESERNTFGPVRVCGLD